MSWLRWLLVVWFGSSLLVLGGFFASYLHCLLQERRERRLLAQEVEEFLRSQP